MGWFRKPGHSLRLRDLSHGLDLGAGRADLRLHIGLENVEDLKADLIGGFEAFNAAGKP